MQSTALIWIRDGVLIERMHLNPVAFAVACILASPDRGSYQLDLHRLVDFAFKHSGISARQKMQNLLQEVGDDAFNIEAASGFYDVITSYAGTYCDYFKGMVSLVQNLAKSKTPQYISSAIDQSLLDQWQKTDQGKMLDGALTEALGARPGFTKGEDHFAYISSKNPGAALIYVADAPSEIKEAKRLSANYDIKTIGYANPVSGDKLASALTLIKKQVIDLFLPELGYQIQKIDFETSDFVGQNPESVVAELKGAGADCIVLSQNLSELSAAVNSFSAQSSS